MWYVMQVQTGQEEEVKVQCEKVVDHTALQNCFVPYYKQMKKYLGKWYLEEKPLFPGYVFLITDHVERLFMELKKVLGLTKLVGVGKTVVPLTENEIDFLQLCCGTSLNVNDKKDMPEDKHVVVDISYGCIEDGTLVITEGPLKGLEKYVKKIDRHKRKAYLEVRMGGELKTMVVGVEIVRKG